MSHGNVDIDLPTLEVKDFSDFIANLQRNLIFETFLSSLTSRGKSNFFLSLV